MNIRQGRLNGLTAAAARVSISDARRCSRSMWFSGASPAHARITLMIAC